MPANVKNGEGYYNCIVPAEMTHDEEKQKKIYDFTAGLKNELGKDWQEKWETIRCGYFGVDKGKHLVTVTLKEK